MVFSVSPTSEGQYDAYVLRDDSSQSRAVVVPERGGIISRWRVGDRSVLYLDRDRFADPSLSIRGGIPILFPICGNLPGNQYTWKGKPYSLKQHGFARDMPWTVGEQSTDNGAALTLTLASNDATRAVYPFEFELAFTYRLLGQSLHIEQQYHNRSDIPMPFSTGLHPYFAIKDKHKLRLDIPAAAYLDQQTGETHEFKGSLDYDRDEIDIAFRSLQRTNAVVDDLGQRSRLSMDFDEGYGTVVFWTVKGKDYYCIEPWTAGRNAINTGDHLWVLEPHATQTFRVTFSVSYLKGMG